MLKRTLAAHIALIFLRLLSSVTGDEGFPGNSFPYDTLPFFLSTLKEMCLQRLDPTLCQHWDSIRYKISDSELPLNALHTKQPLENRTSGKEIPEGLAEEEITIHVPVLDNSLENNLHKRFSVFRRKNPTARGYKRGPGFRSWGGKRDLILSGQNKRSKFASWGGKRDDEVFPDFIISDSEDAAEKRQKFQNWGGKKSTNDFSGEEAKNAMFSNQMEKRGPIWKDRGFYFAEPFKKHVPKRPQFQSWGGKRASYPWRDFLDFFRPPPRLSLNGGEKRKFSSWGGKRYDELENLYRNSDWEEKTMDNTKRQGFQNWGGKRTNSDNEPNAFVVKDSESGETAKERSKREVKTSQQDEEQPYNVDSWGTEESEETKNRR